MPPLEYFITVKVNTKLLTERVLELYENGVSIEDNIDVIVEECIEVIR